MATIRKAAPGPKGIVLPDHAVLSFTGMRRTGKTKVAELVAKRLGFPLFDTDAILESQYHLKVADFVRTSGWEGFRRTETGIILDLFDGIGDRAIISLGGGALAHFDNDYYRNMNIRTVKEGGLVVYLLPSSDLERSARILADRELAAGNDDPNRPPLPQSHPKNRSVFEKIYYTLRQRHPLYMDACDGFVINEYDKSGTPQQQIQQKADEVIERLALRLIRKR